MIYASVNGTYIKQFKLESNYNTAAKRIEFSAPTSLGLDIGTPITATLSSNGVMRNIVGKIKAMTRRRPENTYEFAACDIVTQPAEYWFIPPDINGAWEKSNISHTALSIAILKQAGLVDAQIQNDWPVEYPTFQFATGPEPVKIRIASAWDVISWICQITGMHAYADDAGVIHLSRIWDEPGAVVSRVFEKTTWKLKTIQYSRSDENLRNQVAVFGREGVSLKTAKSADTPAGSGKYYLPTGFYKTAIISYELIDNDSMAQETADINLQRLNKLTESCIIETVGDPTIDIRQTVTVTDPKSDVSGDWFVTQCTHSISPASGYTCKMTVNR